MAALTGAVLDKFGDRLFEGMTELLGNYFFPYLPFALPASLRLNAVGPSLLFLLYWFQPVVLRLNWARTGIWLVASAALGVAALAANQVTDLKYLRLISALLFGFFAGIPGFAVIGRRSRPWMTLVGGALSMGFVSLLDRGAKPWSVFILSASNLIYGAVMLYGTKLLRR